LGKRVTLTVKKRRREIPRAVLGAEGASRGNPVCLKGDSVQNRVGTGEKRRVKGGQ